MLGNTTEANANPGFNTRDDRDGRRVAGARIDYDTDPEEDGYRRHHYRRRELSAKTLQFSGQNSENLHEWCRAIDYELCSIRGWTEQDKVHAVYLQLTGNVKGGSCRWTRIP